MKEDIKILLFDKYEVGLIINALNEVRNNKIELGEDTTFLDEVLLKIIDTPFKKKHVKILESR